MSAIGSHGGGHRTVATFVVAVLGALALAVLVPSAAQAHSVLIGSTPDAGARLTTAPSSVTLRFDENVRSPSKIVVDGPSGRVDRGATRVVDNKVEVTVSMKPAPRYVGRYSIAYRVVSADGHPVSGRVPFTYAPPGVRAAPHQKVVPTTPDRSSRWPVVVGVALVVVVVAGLLLVPWRRIRPRG